MKKAHDRKVGYFTQKENRRVSREEERETYRIKPEKKIKWDDKEAQRRRNRKVKLLDKQKRKKQVENDIKKIKESNLVHNFSSVNIPDNVYLFLALGSSFVMKKMGSKHDDLYDLKLFSRKVRWRAYFREKDGEKKNEETAQVEDFEVDTEIQERNTVADNLEFLKSYDHGIRKTRRL